VRDQAPCSLSSCIRASSSGPRRESRAGGDELLGSRSSCTTVTTTDEEARVAAAEAAALEALDRRQLQRLVLALRTELACAEERLCTAGAEAAAAAAAARHSAERCRQRLSEADENAARLRADNLRLEKSVQQAAAEERMLTELVQLEEPHRAREAMERRRAECQRLERENRQLERRISRGRERLDRLRENPPQRLLRGRPPPRTGGSQRLALSPSSPAAAATGKGGRPLQRHGSLPALRGSGHPG